MGGGGAGFVATTNLNFGGSRLPSKRFSLGVTDVRSSRSWPEYQAFLGEKGRDGNEKGNLHSPSPLGRPDTQAIKVPTDLPRPSLSYGR